MEVIQMESTVHKELMEKIDGIAAYVRKSEKRMSEENAEILLDNQAGTCSSLKSIHMKGRMA